jgi:16S rRNA (adenine1518-N6/adenine1519-N6)-dimethyltransferase
VTHSGADIAHLLSAHGLRPSRALGQNFVADPNTVRRIARMAEVGPGSSVLEFGAGLGSLTLALAETGARVVAVELDRYILPVLRSVAEPVGAEVVKATP